MSCQSDRPSNEPIIGNRFRKRRRRLPSQPDQYCHEAHHMEPPEVSDIPLISANSVVTKSANYVVNNLDDKKLFIATDDVTFTLPDPPTNVSFGFFQSSNNPMALTGNLNIIARGNASASGIEFAGSGQTIGSLCGVKGIDLGGGDWRWLYMQLCNHTINVS